MVICHLNLLLLVTHRCWCDCLVIVYCLIIFKNKTRFNCAWNKHRRIQVLIHNWPKLKDGSSCGSRVETQRWRCSLEEKTHAVELPTGFTWIVRNGINPWNSDSRLVCRWLSQLGSILTNEKKERINVQMYEFPNKYFTCKHHELGTCEPKWNVAIVERISCWNLSVRWWIQWFKQFVFIFR